MAPDRSAERGGNGFAVRDHFIGCMLAARRQRADGRGSDAPPDVALLKKLGLTAFLVGPDVHGFVIETMPVLLRQLNRTTQTAPRVHHGQARGRIDWSATYKARLRESNDPTVLVCREVHRQYATLENQLLKHLLRTIADSVRHVPQHLRAGAYWPASSTDGSRPIHRELSTLQDRLQSYLAHIHLRDIAVPEQITHQHLQKARSSKTVGYTRLARLHAAWTRLTTEGRAHDWTAALRTCLVLPASPAGEGAALVRAAAWALVSP
jgi:hypothetical protein